MAYKVKDYGSGSLGDVESISQNVNSYARISAVSTTGITLNSSNQVTGMATFKVGAKVLIHVSAAVTSNQKTYLGKYLLANVTAMNSNVLTLDEDVTNVIPSAQVGNYYIQAVAVAEFKNLTLSSGTVVSPPIYSTSNYHGGIIALMCSETLTFDGGHISLTDRGIPVASKALRPVSTANYDVEADTSNNAGLENAATKDYFYLNSGDGAAFIVAKKMVCSESSRIGNTTTYGLQFYRGNKTSVTYNETAPTGFTNVGGSSILIVAQEIENFTPKMISKYRSSSSTAGQGICRCYIASETRLRNDEGLYSYDCISRPSRIKEMNIRNFGNGSFGDVSNITTQLNNYASVTAIDGNKLTYKNATTTGLAQLTAGALVMVHFNHKTSTTVTESGRFILANVLSNNGTVLTLDTAPPQISPTEYVCQVVSIPQTMNFTLSVENKATPQFNGSQGGIFAVAVKNTCDLTNGKINVISKGGGQPYGRQGLATIGNAQNSNKLPIGQGHGSIFILAQNLTLDKNTRMGGHTATASGLFAYKNSNCSGASSDKAGYGSNSPTSGYYASSHGPQGAHLMIIADKITGFILSAIGTGGGNSGFCGQGKSGTYNAGGYYYWSPPGGNMYGGSAGWAFIYCNNAVNQDTTNYFYTL